VKPNYFVIGSAKCASTSLCAMLGQHPDVFMTDPKEPNFFNVPKIYARGYDWYESLYDTANGERLRGEGTASYAARTLFPDVPARIHEYSPDAKLVYIVRHPLEKIKSMWLETATWTREAWEKHVGHLDDRKYATTQPSFNKALREGHDILVDPANYWRELDAFWKHFPQEQMLIVFFEEFKRDPQRVLRECFSFLGVDDSVEIPRVHLNSSTASRMPKRSLATIRSHPALHAGYAAARQLLPRRLRSQLSRRFLTTKIEDRPEYDHETLAWLVDLLENDARRLLEYCGRPADYWKFPTLPARQATKRS